MINSQDIFDRLGGKRHNGYYMVPCPAHEDNTPSLSVRERDGTVLVKCHAGCSQQDVIDALRAINLWGGESDPSEREWQRRRSAELKEAEQERERERSRQVMSILRAAAGASGPWRDDQPWKRPPAPTDYLQGRGLSRVPPCASTLKPADAARLTKKPFPAMVVPIVDASGRLQGCQITWLDREGKGKLAVRDGKARRNYGKISGGCVPLAKSDPDRPLIVGEGVESVLAAMEITGLPGVAALSAGNLSGVNLPPCAEVVVAADNDERGRSAANELADRVKGLGGMVRIALPPKEDQDWNDALNSGVDVAELREAFGKASEGGIEVRSDKIDDEVPELTMADFLKIEAPAYEYLLKPWLTTRSVGMIHAAAGQGKTWLALSIAYAVATGQPLMDWTPARQASVLYVDGELPIKLVQQRLQLLGGATPGLYILSCERCHELFGFSPDLSTEDGRAFLDKSIERQKAELIVLDPLSALVRTGAENEAESWAPIQDWAMKHRWRGRAVIFVHHEGKSGKQRGTSKREDVMDWRLRLKEAPEEAGEDESAFLLTFPKKRGFYGADAAARIVKLSTADGLVEWTRCEPSVGTSVGTSVVKSNTRDRVADLLGEGKAQKEIAKELGITPGRVSQIVKELDNVVWLHGKPEDER